MPFYKPTSSNTQQLHFLGGVGWLWPVQPGQCCEILWGPGCGTAMALQDVIECNSRCESEGVFPKHFLPKAYLTFGSSVSNISWQSSRANCLSWSASPSDTMAETKPRLLRVFAARTCSMKAKPLASKRSRHWTRHRWKRSNCSAPRTVL